MKAVKLFLISFLIAVQSIAQPPQKMSYQVVVRNSTNTVVANHSVGIRISILQGSTTGTIAFSEVHTTTTNANGLASFVIGEGSVVTGTFAGINWGSGPYFIQTEIDPAGGSNYTITGTSQLMSVPYALYAGSSGKSHLIIGGNITNAQAAAKIATEAGPNTKFVWIQYSKTLTAINLAGLTNLVELVVQYNDNLQSISMPGLSSVESKISINNNRALNTIDLPDLTNVIGIFNIQENAILQSTSFPSLTTASSNISIVSNPNITTISFPSLATNVGDILVSGNPVITSINFPVLTETKKLRVTNNNVLANFSLPTLQEATYLEITNPKLTSISFPSLVNINFDEGNLTTNGMYIYSNALLSTISFPVLQTVYTRMEIAGNSAPLTSLNFPMLLNVYGTLTIFANSGLASVSFPALVNSSSLMIMNNGVLTAVSFPNLATISSLNFRLNVLATFLQLNALVSATGNISITANDKLTSISFSSLATAGNLEISTASASLSISAPALASVTGNISFSGPIATPIAFPALTSIGGGLYEGSSTTNSYPNLVSISLVNLNTGSLSMPKLVKGGSFFLYRVTSLDFPLLDTVLTFRVTTSLLTSLSLPQLHMVQGDLQVYNNPQLASLTIPNLQTIGPYSTSAAVLLNLNKLPTSQINTFLNTLVNLSPAITSKTISLKQTPAAPPTGQGLVDKATLQSRGNVVSTD